MKPLVEVQRSVLTSVRRLEKLAVPITQARGLVLADDVLAPSRCSAVRQLGNGRICGASRGYPTCTV